MQPTVRDMTYEREANCSFIDMMFNSQFTISLKNITVPKWTLRGDSNSLKMWPYESLRKTSYVVFVTDSINESNLSLWVFKMLFWNFVPKNEKR